MARGFPEPADKRGQLVAACLRGESIRSAADRFKVGKSTAARWVREHRESVRPVAGGSDGGTDGTGWAVPSSQPPPPPASKLPIPSAEEVNAWAVRFLAQSGESLHSLAVLAGDPLWQKRLDGDQYAAVVRCLLEATLAVAAAQRAPDDGGDRPGPIVEAPAEAGTDAGRD